uniref:Uncharacterized protein n=1 Tax=Picea glauca TaxID=3330 RepID=A0A101M2T0_PICGL|nr:hypothetical protein ABT39_MTgene3146 [Picea glauca]QHR86102.1 hypothetical protein Q903MT_gene100 [Picea sitchensis]
MDGLPSLMAMSLIRGKVIDSTLSSSFPCNPSTYLLMGGPDMNDHPSTNSDLCNNQSEDSFYPTRPQSRFNNYQNGGIPGWQLSNLGVVG